jgi:hypothetical protein
MKENLAEHGWMLRVDTIEAASQPAVMYFAVGKNSSQEAVAAVLEYPGIENGDEVTWADQLTSTEIGSFRLRPDEVRTYGKRPLSPRDQRSLSGTSRKLAQTVSPRPGVT